MIDNSESQCLIRARKLVKRYGELEALRSISFDINAGDIFGFIGPDGAGKTTLFHILGGVIKNDEGSIEIMGELPHQVKSDIGYLTQSFSLYLDLSVNENIQYSGALRQVGSVELKKRKEELLEQMDLARFSNRLAGQLSGGMKQKLALCCALVSRPRILLLDEPTTGVDPVSRRELWDILTRVAQDGITVVAATPYLDEAERCNRIALMYEGQIEAMGSVDQLKADLNLSRVETRSSDLDKLASILDKDVAFVEDIQRFGDRLDILGADAEAVVRSVQELGEKNGLGIETSIESPTLENVFVHELRRTSQSEDRGLFKFSDRLG